MTQILARFLLPAVSENKNAKDIAHASIVSNKKLPHHERNSAKTLELFLGKTDTVL